ncbi:hypothetical protein DBP18_25435 [Streptomyces sp. CS081A]|nr:hypothetical protein DBP18_25435 [Streptomyces sp. CS081A]
MADCDPHGRLPSSRALVTSGPLARGSGRRLLEAPMAQRPGHAAHEARASGFPPRPPHRRADGTAAR